MNIGIGSSAVISDCGKYRYRLDRHIDNSENGIIIAYFGVNPSTADADIDDATVRKWRGFTKKNGGSRFLVGNVFAFRSTDVKGLAGAEDPVGVLNESYLYQISREADVLVPCWGNIGKVPKSLRWQFRRTMELLRKTGKPIKIFGLTKNGSPKHPLMLGYKTELVEFNPTQ